MRKPKVIHYKGKEIVFLDFSNLNNPDEIIQLINEGSKIIRQKPFKSVLSMVCVENMYFNNEVRNTLHNNVKANNPHVKKSVIYGMSGLIKSLFASFLKFTGRNLRSVKTREEALEYLIN